MTVICTLRDASQLGQNRPALLIDFCCPSSLSVIITRFLNYLGFFDLDTFLCGRNSGCEWAARVTGFE